MGVISSTGERRINSSRADSTTSISIDNGGLSIQPEDAQERTAGPSPHASVCGDRGCQERVRKRFRCEDGEGGRRRPASPQVGGPGAIKSEYLFGFDDLVLEALDDPVAQNTEYVRGF